MNRSKAAILAITVAIIGLLAWPAIAQASTIERVSLASDGTQADESSYGSSVSADGRYVAFTSEATTLVAGDTNGCEDVFVYDRLTGEITLVSVNTSGGVGNGYSYDASISADGSHVAFVSQATDLVATDENGHADVFVYDLSTLTMTLASVGYSGDQADADCYYPSISGDGTYVAFQSSATNLGSSEDTAGYEDVFIRDLSTPATLLVSVAPDGVTLGDSHSGHPSMSSDGGYVAFQSSATNLLPVGVTSGQQVFVRDLGTYTNILASVSWEGYEGNASSSSPSISSYGDYVAFESSATNFLEAGPTSGTQIFVRDFAASATLLVSADDSGTEGDSDSSSPSISDDGSYVAFSSTATNLLGAGGDANGYSDVFVRDLLGSTTTRQSVDIVGSEADNESYAPSLSAGGACLAFESSATNLVGGDTNGKYDVFVAALDPSPVIDYLDPSYGAEGALNEVTIYGKNFAGLSGESAVTFGGFTAFSYEVVSSMQITARTQAQTAGDKLVVVTNPVGASDDLVYLTLYARPTVTSVDPTQGSVLGGDTVTIYGTDFVNVNWVQFGDSYAYPDSYTETEMTVTSPAHASGTVQVVVDAAGGTSTDYVLYEYMPLPSVTGLSVSYGPPAGGDTITVYGTGFTEPGGAAVAFGTVAATDVNVLGDTELTCTVPAHAVGIVQVQVTNVWGDSADTTADDYTYLGIPVVMGSTQRMNLDSDENQANNGGYSAAIDAQGDLVAFASTADNLVPGDNNGCADVFVRDRYTGVTERVSVNSWGEEGNSDSQEPAISSDGRYVAFSSWASNLVADDTNYQSDIFVYDRLTGDTTRVSVDGSANQANSSSYRPSLSWDGSYVVYESYASNLVPGDTNGSCDVFRYDRVSGVVALVSVDSAGNQGNSDSYEAVIDLSGAYVAFTSDADNLVTDDGNGHVDVFVWDSTTGETTRVSVDSDGNEGNASSESPSITDGSFGLYVAFESWADNLVADDTNYTADIFVRDLSGATTVRVSLDSSEAEADGSSQNPSINWNAHYVTFESEASDLVEGDTNGRSDIFMRNVNGLGSLPPDPDEGTTLRVNVDGNGGQADSDSYDPCASADGRYVAFQSDATNLVTGDTNGTTDVFYAPTVPGSSPWGVNAGMGPVAGGNSVIITGRYFADVSAVTFVDTSAGTSAPALSFTADSLNQITAVAPPGTAGDTIRVMVSTPQGDSVDNYADDYMYWPLPTVASVTPDHVTTYGYDVVTITGSNFEMMVNSVTIGGMKAKGFEVVSDTELTAVVPPYGGGSLEAQVQVTTPGGTSTDLVYLTYCWPPIISSLDPSYGPTAGGNTVTIYGSEFVGVDPATGVMFGDEGATDVVIYSDHITCTAPAHAPGSVQVTVTGTYGQSEKTSASIYVYPGIPVVRGLTELLSVDSSEVEGNSGSYPQSTSADGRYTAFASWADNLVADDTNGAWDIFVRDRVTGTTERVSVATGGGQATGDSYSPSISADGRYVAFESNAVDLVAGDTNEAWDVFVHDRLTGTTERASVDGTEGEANGDSYNASISGDGVFVAFTSYADDLVGVGVDTNGHSDIFVRDLDEGITVRASVVDGTGAEAIGGNSDYASLNYDGFYVAFESDASNLVGGDTYGATDIFVHCLLDDSTVRASVADGTAAEAEGWSNSPSISADGQYVAFESDAANLVAGDTNNVSDVFVHHLSGTTQRVSEAAGGVQVSDESHSPSITADGSRVAFMSLADDLVVDDNNGLVDVFVREGSGAPIRVNLASDGSEADGWSWDPAISADGLQVVYDSIATNLVAGGTNGADHVFMSPADPSAASGILPSSGSADGGNPVIISGTDFYGVTDVFFGPNRVPDGSWSVVSPNQISAVAPANTEDESVHVTVTNGEGTSAQTEADYYTYVVPPVVTGVSPAYGSLAGGTELTIIGSGFTGATAVTFGGVDASSFRVDDDGQISAEAPAGTAGVVQVQVIGPYGSSHDTAADDFEYLPAPTITGLDPAYGHAAAGTPVTIYGTDLIGFTNPVDVVFGGPGALSLNWISRTEIQVTAPAGTGGTDVNVRLVTPGGMSADAGTADDYHYAGTPTVVSLSRTAGSVDGGTPVVITGTEFYGVTDVTFGGTDAVFTRDSPTQITATSPYRGGAVETVDVRVVAVGGTSVDAGVADDFKYVEGPEISLLTPNAGPRTGGTTVVITGANFTGATTVTFGGTAAGFTFDSDSQITAVAPAHAAGTVQVQVTTAEGASENTANDDYTYLPTNWYQQTDSRLGYAGSWYTTAVSSASGGSYGYANSAGSSVTIKFSGTGLALLAKKSPAYGQALVTLDGGAPVYVDLYSPSTLYQQNVYGTGQLPNADHTLVVTWAGAKNPASTGYLITVDALYVAGTLKQALSGGVTNYQQTDSRLYYSSGWYTATSSSASGGSYAYANSSGALVKIDFYGTGLALIAKKSPAYGRAKLTLDGGTPVYVDLYSPSVADQQNVYGTGTLTEGEHSLVVEWAGAKNAASSGYLIDVDAMYVAGSLIQAEPPAGTVLGFQQTDPHLVYAGSWYTAVVSAASGGSYTYANSAGSAVTVNFSGTALALIAKTGPSYGKATLTLDGGTPVEVNFYSAATLYQQNIYGTGALTDGDHTLVIEWAGHKSTASTGYLIDLDALYVAGTLK